MKMQTMIKIYIFAWIIRSVLSDICYSNSSNGVTGSWFCCNNYEERNGTCEECEIGYVSKDGFPCEPCSPGQRWGRKCRDVCLCKHNERCDIVYGCLEVTTFMSEKWESTKPRESTYAATTASIISTADNNGGFLLKREIIIYSISAGSIAVMVALGLCCFKYKRKAEHLYKSRLSRTNRVQTSAEQSNVQYSRNHESVYDLIDEDNMIGDETIIHSATGGGHVIQTRTTHYNVDSDGSSSSHSEGDAINSISEGYLNPYQPMVEVDLHGYRTLSKDTTHNSEKLSSGNSESSVCSADKTNALVRPYQSIIPCVDIHNYTPIDEAVQTLTSHIQSTSDIDTGNNDDDADQPSESLTISLPIAIELEDVKNQNEQGSVEAESKDGDNHNEPSASKRENNGKTDQNN